MVKWNGGDGVAEGGVVEEGGKANCYWFILDRNQIVYNLLKELIISNYREKIGVRLPVIGNSFDKTWSAFFFNFSREREINARKQKKKQAVIARTYLIWNNIPKMDQKIKKL